MLTVYGGEGGREMGRCVFSQWGRWGKTSVHTFCNLFLKTLTEGAVTTEAGRLLQYFTTLSFSGGSRLGVPCRGVHLGHFELEGGKTSSDQYPNGP